MMLDNDSYIKWYGLGEDGNGHRAVNLLYPYCVVPHDDAGVRLFDCPQEAMAYAAVLRIEGKEFTFRRYDNGGFCWVDAKGFE